MLVKSISPDITSLAFAPAFGLDGLAPPHWLNPDGGPATVHVVFGNGVADVDAALGLRLIAAGQAVAVDGAEADTETTTSVVGSEPPADLKTPEGLPPKRARLAAFYAWQRRLADEIVEAEAERQRLLAAFGAPAETRGALARLIEEDRSGLLRWLQASPTAPLTEAEVRSAERRRLEKQLEDDEHRREIALGALDEVEARITRLRQDADVLAAREHDFIAPALVEEAAALGEVYRRQVTEVSITINALWGLAVLVGGSDDFKPGGVPEGAEVRLPGFGLPALTTERWGRQISIVAEGRTLRGATERWKAKAAEWRTELGAPQAEAADEKAA